MMDKYRVSCFDSQGHLEEFEEFGLPERAWEFFEEHYQKHHFVQHDIVNSLGALVRRLASVGNNSNPIPSIVCQGSTH